MTSLPISEKGYHSNAPNQYTARKIAAPNTLEHRIYIERDGMPVSPFHDIPLYANETHTVLNMIVEVPRWTNAKMEVSFVAPCLFPITRHMKTPLLTQFNLVDLEGGEAQPYQARHQEGQASLRPQLLPSQGLPLELRRFPPGMVARRFQACDGSMES